MKARQIISLRHSDLPCLDMTFVAAQSPYPPHLRFSKLCYATGRGSRHGLVCGAESGPVFLSSQPVCGSRGKLRLWLKRGPGSRTPTLSYSRLVYPFPRAVCCDSKTRTIRSRVSLILFLTQTTPPLPSPSLGLVSASVPSLAVPCHWMGPWDCLCRRHCVFVTPGSVPQLSLLAARTARQCATHSARIVPCACGCCPRADHACDGACVPGI